MTSLMRDTRSTARCMVKLDLTTTRNIVLVSGSSLQSGSSIPSPLEKSSNPREYPETYLTNIESMKGKVRHKQKK